MPPPHFLRPKLRGSVTVRRLHPPQLETVAAIAKGEFTESLTSLASRIGLRALAGDNSPAADFCVVDDQGLALMGKLVDGGVYYLSGGEPVTTLVDPDHLGYGGQAQGVGTQGSAGHAPDTAVWWAFDPRMLLHASNASRSPETPHRLQRGIEALQRCDRAQDILPSELLVPLSGNIDGSMHIDSHRTAAKVRACNLAKWIPPRLAAAVEVYAFHVQAPYHAFLDSGTALKNLKSDVYCSDTTSSIAARLAAGAVIDASAAVLQSVVTVRHAVRAKTPTDGVVAYCLIRPPGHHCTASTPGGFCLINNVAIAAAVLRIRCANLLSHSPPRIAILDLDVHFGEGTAEFVDEVADASTLLYLSLHRYDGGNFYPFDRRGDTSYVGPASTNTVGRGCICNIAIDTQAHHPAQCEQVISDYLLERAVEEIFLPRLAQFRPDLVLVSLGFDAAYGDPLGRMAVEGGFASVLARLKAWCADPDNAAGLVTVLEGGYKPEAVAQGIVAVGLALSLPRTDPTVQVLVRPQIPKVWADLRLRQERRLREWQQQQREEAMERGEKATAHEMGGTPPEQVCEDSILLERHKAWCDMVLAEVKQRHAAALRTLS